MEPGHIGFERVHEKDAALPGIEEVVMSFRSWCALIRIIHALDIKEDEEEEWWRREGMGEKRGEG